MFCVLLSSFYSIKIYSLRVNAIESLSHIDEIVSGDRLDKVASNITYHGDSNRLNILHHVSGMIKEKPFLGSGLGSVIITQVRETGSYIDLMDCTALWLWAETGVIGLLFFLTFYILCFRAIWKKAHNKDAPEFTQRFSMGAILMLLTFGVMSLFHELLYTRFLWVFLGMALTLPIVKKV
jgi:O-antigen ligase